MCAVLTKHHGWSHFWQAALPITIELTLWSYPMTVNTSLLDRSINETVRTSIRNLTGTGTGAGATGAFFQRQSLPNSYNASGQISASVGMTVLGGSDSLQPLVASDFAVSQKVSLRPGQTISVVTSVFTSIDAATVANGGTRPPAPWRAFAAAALSDCVEHLTKLQSQINAAATIRAEAQSYWAAFWAKSSISLPSEPLISFYWHAAQSLSTCLAHPAALGRSRQACTVPG